MKMTILAIGLMMAVLAVIVWMHVMSFEECLDNFSLYECHEMEK